VSWSSMILALPAGRGDCLLQSFADRNPPPRLRLAVAQKPVPVGYEREDFWPFEDVFGSVDCLKPAPLVEARIAMLK